jgi:hypothetical protein
MAKTKLLQGIENDKKTKFSLLMGLLTPFWLLAA